MRTISDLFSLTMVLYRNAFRMLSQSFSIYSATDLVSRESTFTSDTSKSVVLNKVFLNLPTSWCLTCCSCAFLRLFLVFSSFFMRCAVFSLALMKSGFFLFSSSSFSRMSLSSCCTSLYILPTSFFAVFISSSVFSFLEVALSTSCNENETLLRESKKTS